MSNINITKKMHNKTLMYMETKISNPMELDFLPSGSLI